MGVGLGLGLKGEGLGLGLELGIGLGLSVDLHIGSLRRDDAHQIDDCNRRALTRLCPGPRARGPQIRVRVRGPLGPQGHIRIDGLGSQSQRMRLILGLGIKGAM